ncbi:acyl--CoA ligase [Streptomyces sp. SCA2-4]|nr:acyl--CoA ligase [Streptomyces huiliensis]
MAFRTSGTTGEPVAWLRTETQVRAEAELVLECLLGPVDHVVSYAPTTHLYGYLYADVLPRLTGARVEHAWRDPIAPPRIPDGRRTLLVCLPSTWEPLVRHTAELARHSGLIALHSTGPTTPAAHRTVARLRGTGFRAVELLGSTETGAVAHRSVAPEGEPPPPWRLLPDVAWPGADRDGEQRLRVSGPRLARRWDQASPPADHELSDLVIRAGERSFHHLGRAARLVKVNGRRCDLGRVEALARTCGRGLDAACAAVPDPLRGEHYELYYAAPDPALDPAVLRSRLARLGPDLPAPRAVHRVARIPRGATGKVLTSRLQAAAARPRPSQETDHG